MDIKITERNLLKIFNVPLRYIEIEENNSLLINYCIKNFAGGFVFSGCPGVGKTHLAISILKCLLEAEKKPQQRKLQQAIFKTNSDLLLEIRDSLCQKGQSESELVDFYSKIPLLILDDIGSESATEFVLSTLFLIIDRRYLELKDTIFTTNLSQNQLKEKLGDRISFRLCNMPFITIDGQNFLKK